MSKDWFLRVEAIFEDRSDEVDFASGRMLPRWESEPPEWIHAIEDSVLAVRDYGEEEWGHPADSPIMTGGHGVMKLSVLKEVGGYNVDVCPTGTDLVGCEDDLLYEQLISRQKNGIYCPDLVFYGFRPKLPA